MRASNCIVAGSFCGAEIEGGTFHLHETLATRATCDCPKADLTAQADRNADASDRVPAPRGCDIESSSPDRADRVSEASDRQLRDDDGTPVQFH